MLGLEISLEFRAHSSTWIEDLRKSRTSLISTPSVYSLLLDFPRYLTDTLLQWLERCLVSLPLREASHPWWESFYWYIVQVNHHFVRNHLPMGHVYLESIGRPWDAPDPSRSHKTLLVSCCRFHNRMLTIRYVSGILWTGNTTQWDRPDLHYERHISDRRLDRDSHPAVDSR